jgi:hypothetical protein
LSWPQIFTSTPLDAKIIEQTVAIAPSPIIETDLYVFGVSFIIALDANFTKKPACFLRKTRFYLFL